MTPSPSRSSASTSKTQTSVFFLFLILYNNFDNEVRTQMAAHRIQPIGLQLAIIETRFEALTLLLSGARFF